MTNRQLLELAAKANGNAASFDWDDWSPLTDDGDALRLAVKLGCTPDIDYEMGFVTVLISMTHGIQEELGSDPYAATRRAIVRAAAEIGKGTTFRKEC